MHEEMRNPEDKINIFLSFATSDNPDYKFVAYWVLKQHLLMAEHNIEEFKE